MGGQPVGMDRRRDDEEAPKGAAMRPKRQWRLAMPGWGVGRRARLCASKGDAASRITLPVKPSHRSARLWRCCPLALAGLAATAAFGQMQTSDLNVKSRHGDWEIACKAPPPGAKKEICALVQTVAAEDDDNVVISVHFLKYSDGSRVLRIFTPLGVALAKGMRLNIDDTQSVQASYSRCAQYGCFAQIEPDDKLFELLKTGKRVLVVIYRTEEAGIGIPISLAGFNQGLAALQ
jgi:invasion protein IalB